MIACAKVKALEPFNNIKITCISLNLFKQKSIKITLKTIKTQSYYLSKYGLGLYQYHQLLNDTFTVPYLKHVKQIYFYNYGWFDDLATVVLNGVSRLGLGANRYDGAPKLEGTYYYSDDQVKQIIANANGNTINIQIGVTDIYGGECFVEGDTIIYFVYE